VSGVLPVLLGKATKIAKLLTKAGKEYVGVLYLHGEIPDEALLLALEEFTGLIFQRPPIKSTVKRRLRTRRIYEIELIERQDRYILLRISVEAGTYIRKLFHDIGEFLGCGASMRELRRIRTGPLTETSSITLQELEKAVLMWENTGNDAYLREKIIPLEHIVAQLLPKIVVKDTAVAAIAHGASVKAPGVCAFSKDMRRNDSVGIFTLKGELVALGRVLVGSEDLIELEKGIVAEPTRVIMDRNLYPVLWKKNE